MGICTNCGKPTGPLALLCPDCYSKTEDKLSQTPTDFIKADNGKLEWDLLPFREMEAVIRILMFGKKKYRRDNWQKCDDISRYKNAAMRHLVSYMKNEKMDPESGENHLAHLICNALFLMWFDNQEKTNEEFTREELRPQK